LNFLFSPKGNKYLSSHGVATLYPDTERGEMDTLKAFRENEKRMLGFNEDSYLEILERAGCDKVAYEILVAKSPQYGDGHLSMIDQQRKLEQDKKQYERALIRRAKNDPCHSTQKA